MQRAAGMRAFALLLLPPLSGCSLLFVESPPPSHHQRLRYFDCTSSRLAPIVDTVVATSYGLTGVAMAAYAADDEVRGDAVPMVLLPLGVAALFGVSAAHGFSTTSDCEDAKARFASEVLSTPPPKAPPSATCGRDADCPGEQICEQGACVIVLPPVPLTVPAPPSEAPPPADTPLPAPTPVASPPAPGP